MTMETTVYWGVPLCSVYIFTDISGESDPSRLKGTGFLWNVSIAGCLMTCERVSLTACLPHLAVHVQRWLSVVGGHSLSHICAEPLIGWTTYTPTRLQSVMSQKMVLTVDVAELCFISNLLWGALYTVRMIVGRSQLPERKAFFNFSFMSYITFVTLMMDLRSWNLSLY